MKQEILEKAIQKAIDGGFKPPLGDVEVPNQATWPHNPADIFAYYGAYRMPQWGMIIFNHDFAKALWGEETWYFTEDCEWLPETKVISQYLIDIPAWQYHLQQMVIADDPIKYLGDNI